jgi:hypothetical protein
MLRKPFSVALMAMFVMATMTALSSAQTTSPSSKTHEMGTMMQPKGDWHASMRELWKSDQALADEWAKIEEHYNKVMAITDQAQLKQEMTAHQAMMTAYRDKMMENSKMWRQTMAMYEPTTTQGVATQTKSNDSQNKTPLPAKH